MTPVNDDLEAFTRSTATEQAPQSFDADSPAHDIPLPGNAAGGLLQRPALAHPANAPVRAMALQRTQQTSGNRAAQRAAGFVQTKLTVSEPGDPLEREADAIADAAVSGSACSCGGTREDCASRAVAERRETDASASGVSADAVLPETLGPGQALDSGIRDDMATRFGRNFDDVRIHTEAGASDAARSLDAQAYTVGHDIVFGHGEFNPGTSEGQHLLAHELTHVVQQRSGGEPRVQRRLKMTGSQGDIDAALGLLEPPSDLDLKHDTRTTQVSVKKDGGKPASPELASRLKQIVNDAKQHAEVHFGRKQEGVFVGAFPGDPDKPVQEVRIDHVLALEKGAPASGVSKLAHEIVENYQAHALKDLDWTDAFEVAHGAAIETENLVQKELGHPGARRNTFAVYSDAVGKTPAFNRHIGDRGSHFLVVDQSFGGTGALSNARRVGRLAVSKYKIEGFSSSSADLPKAAAATIASLASDMKGSPTASAYVEGFASTEGTPGDNIELGLKRSDRVIDAVIDLVGDRMNTNWRRFEFVGHDAKKWNVVVITVERPDL